MRPLLLAAVLSFARCGLYADGDHEELACTREFRSESVRVLTAADVPVADASVEVVRVSSGRSIVCTSAAQTRCLDRSAWTGHEDGFYVVMDDGVALSRSGENFRVIVSRGTARAEAVLRFRHDGCHLERVSGPTVLRLPS